MSLGDLLGNVDENGVLQAYSGDINFVGTGIRDIGEKALENAFYGKTKMKTISFPDLTTVSKNYSCSYMCYQCTSLTSVDLGSLVDISGYNTFERAFSDCENLTDVNLRNLTTITSAGCTNMFRKCKKLTSIDLSNLTTITNSQQYMFGDSGLTEISFPKLQEVSNNALSNMFSGCKSMKIHFRADMQATIEALSGYSSKFGASSSTIYFDL